MYHLWQEYQKEYVTVSLVGDNHFKGIIFDSGADIIVLFNGENFFYIPISHIEYIAADTPDTEFKQPSTFPNTPLNKKEELTLDSILNEAKGVYQELCVINKKILHGTILEVLEDYIAFYSPIYKKIYVAKKHLKWLSPYLQNERPYDLSEVEFNWKQVEKEFKVNFIQQLMALSNKLVILNLGEKISHIGKVENISDKMLELKTVKGKNMFVNIEHIQTFHEV